ncbi:MAG TPA: ATP-binding protein [Opitutus sp.]|nr:ATP-binding protein [Opitutus sp.]
MLSRRSLGPALRLLPLLVFFSGQRIFAGPVTLFETASDFWSIPTAERTKPHEGRLELTALYYDATWRVLWAVDREGSEAFFPIQNASPRIRSGQHFIIAGSFIPANGLDLASAKITLLPDRSLPAPLSTRGDFANADRFNGRLVTVEAYVNSQVEIGSNHLQLELAVEGYPATARLQIDDNRPIPQVDGAFVRLTGVYVFDTPASAFHPNLWVAGPGDLQIVGWLDRDPRFQIPVIPIEDLAAAPLSRAAHIAGEVVSQEPGVNVVVRDASGQATLLTAMTQPVKRGEPVEAVGFPSTDGVTPLLRACLYRPAGTALTPAATTRGLSLLRLADQVRQLSPDDAARGYPIRLNGVVTWSRPDNRTFYLLDPSGGVAVRLSQNTTEPPAVGSRLTVTGYSMAGNYAPAVAAESIVSIETLALPAPHSVTLEQAMTGVEESQWIAMTGYVREALLSRTQTRLTISTSSGDFTAVVPRSQRIDALAGTVIRANGVCRAITDANRQLTGIELWVPTVDDVVIEEPKPADPFSVPLRSIASLRRFNTIDSFNRRVRVVGTVLYQESGAYLNLQQDDQSLVVYSRDPAGVRPGDRVEAVGFPGRQGRRLVLREASFRVTGHAAEPPPFHLDHSEVLHPELDGRLVQIVAKIAEAGHQTGGLRLVCSSGGRVFEAVSHHHDPALPDTIDRDCVARLTGVYDLQTFQNGAPPVFRLLLRSVGDVAVIEPSPWWTATRVKSLVAALALAIVLVVTWLVALRRRVQHQTTQIRRQFEKAERLEAEMVRASKLESLGVLAGGIAHDFNNLLGVILGNVSLVLGSRSLGSEDERFLRQSERAAFRARDLTQQLLTFARGGAPVRSVVEIADVVREATGFALHGTKLRAEFDFPPDLWPAHIDRGQVSQVIHNIVLNACHAMPGGGSLQVGLGNETIATGSSVPLAPGRYLRLEIRDQGTGIKPEHLPRIFDPYFTTKSNGSGLGLATAYSIVKKHSGYIAVDSRVGRGTTFHVWLPAAAAIPEEPGEKPARAPRLSGRALVMDDEVAVRDMAAAMLRRLGFEVTATNNGDELIGSYTSALAARRPFNVVIVDLTVPGAKGGQEAIAELRKVDPGIRAIVSSGYSNDPVMAAYRDYGFVNRIPKPYRFDQFAEAVASVVEGPRLASS